jgi:signal transduction histidine kinase
MDAIIKEIITLLTLPPGNLTYHIVLAFSATFAFQIAFNQWRASRAPQAGRMALGLSLLVLMRLTLLVLAGLAWQGLINEHVLLPPLDRGLTLLSLVLVVWLWTFPEPLKLADAATLLLTLLAASLFALSLVWWSDQDPSLPYNGSWPDQVADASALLVLGLGLLLLVLRRPNAWNIGLGVFLPLALGHAASLVFPEFANLASRDFPGLVRAGQIIAYPLLLALPWRFALPGQQPAEAPLQEGTPTSSLERSPGIEPELLNHFLELAATDDPRQACQIAARAVASALMADVCLLILPPGPEGDLTVHCGYDLIRQQPLPGASLRSRQAPMLASAAGRGLSLRLPASSTSTDLRALAEALNLPGSGHLLSAPLPPPSGGVSYSLVLLSPYSNRSWSQEDQSHLNRLAAPLAQLLHRNMLQGQAGSELNQARLEAETHQAQLAELSNELEQMQARLQSTQEQLERYRQQAESLAALIADRERQEPAQPQSRQLLRQALRGESDSEESELRLALEEIARLQAALAEIEQKTMLLKGGSNGSARDQVMNEEAATLVQELRQPMSAIIGYTDFLLGESVGILGALQRKFLERVKMSTERMNHLVEDLFRLVAPGSEGARSGVGGTTDLYTVVDDAIAQVREQVQTAKVQLRVDLPDQALTLCVDHESLAQSLAHLLENAACVTAEGGEIWLRAQLEGQAHQNRYLLLQVSDQGQGVPPEMMPRVFSRYTLGEGRPIPGIAANGANLPIVKALVENMGGRIWVDSQPQAGSTFSILLPLNEQLDLADLADGGLPG